MIAGAATRIYPVWSKAEGHKASRPMLVERPVTKLVKINDLTIQFSVRNERYKAAYNEMRLAIRIVGGDRLVLLEKLHNEPEAGAAKSVIGVKVLGSREIRADGVVLQPDGQPLVVDGEEVNVYKERKLPAEVVFPRLGALPATRDQTPLPPWRESRPLPAHFWEGPPGETPILVTGEETGAKFKISFHRDSAFLEGWHNGNLRFSRAGDKLTVYSNETWLGVVKLEKQKPGKSIDLAVAAPIVNYGPWMRYVFDKKTGARDYAEARSYFLAKEPAYRQLFPPLLRFARDYFEAGELTTGQTLNIFSLLLEGTGLVEKDQWYDQQEKRWLLPGGRFTLGAGLTEEKLAAIFAHSMVLSRQWGGLTDGQFDLVALYLGEMARRKGEPMSLAARENIKRLYYSGRTA